MAVRIWLRAGTFTGTGHEVDSSTAVYTHVSSDFMNNALRRALAPALGDCSGRKESR
jgi:integrase/recombinase XerC